MQLDRPKPTDQIGLGVGAVEGVTQMRSDYPGHAAQPLERSKTGVAPGKGRNSVFITLRACEMAYESARYVFSGLNSYSY